VRRVEGRRTYLSFKTREVGCDQRNAALPPGGRLRRSIFDPRLERPVHRVKAPLGVAQHAAEEGYEQPAHDLVVAEADPVVPERLEHEPVLAVEQAPYPEVPEPAELAIRRTSGAKRWSGSTPADYRRS
jgi:hypothetical protein